MTKPQTTAHTQTTATWAGVLIDPETTTIEAVQIPADWTSIAPAIDADLFDVVRVDKRGHVLYVDDEGLMKGSVTGFTIWHGYPQPLAGKLLLLGTDAEGETTNAQMTAEEVRAKVGFVTSFAKGPGGVLIAMTDDMKLTRIT
jgi:hypothetical protein